MAAPPAATDRGHRRQLPTTGCSRTRTSSLATFAVSPFTSSFPFTSRIMRSAIATAAVLGASSVLAAPGALEARLSSDPHRTCRACLRTRHALTLNSRSHHRSALRVELVLRPGRVPHDRPARVQIRPGLPARRAHHWRCVVDVLPARLRQPRLQAREPRPVRQHDRRVQQRWRRRHRRRHP
jgi:hypothetical protein